ncbi:MAG: 50S ribosomal protein L32 [Patescibacteria group bacterium]
MGVPICRHNHRRRGNRRSHNALENIMTVNCPKCKAVVLPHHVCKVCGTYNDRKVLKVEKRVEKALVKATATKQTSTDKK